MFVAGSLTRHYGPVRVTLSVVLIVLSTASVSGLNTDTHRLVNQQAAEKSAVFEEYLNTAGFPNGLETVVNGRTIRQWLEQGGEREDNLLRFLRHFHDPLQSWDFAGLNLGISRHQSSVRWMQDPHQGGITTGGFASWGDARRLYYEALTETRADQREVLWSVLFLTLGQIMHLVVDASVPEHTRNDAHPLGGLTSMSSYEYWVSGQHQTAELTGPFIARFLSAPIGFDPDILRQQPPVGESIAKVPVARLIDADRYLGGNPSVTVDPLDPRAAVSVGLAEIANANFYSEDTFRDAYPSPTDQGLIRVNLENPSGRVRRYFSRPAGLGLLPANPLRAECVSEDYGLESPPYPCMDEVVWNQTAAHMLPRAVGYASGVLDYFFRGRIAVTGVEWTQQGVTISVQNTSAEEIEGVFEVYARHQPGSSMERRTRLAVLEDDVPVVLGPGERWWFYLPIPPDVVPTASHVLVFKGRLGLEEGAVIGQSFTVPYVEVRQTTYEANLSPTCGRQPPTGVQPPYPVGATVTITAESMRCEWRVVNHRVSGTLQTNTWRDPATGRREPIVARIDAMWLGGDVQGPAPLIVDGQAVGSRWQRQGDEPDPSTFMIQDPTDRGRSYLYLAVTYVNGGDLVAQMAIFTWPSSAHGKQIVLDNRNPSAPQYLVMSNRIVSGFAAYNWQTTGRISSPLFEPVSHGGFPAPSDLQTERRFGGSRVFSEGVRVSAESYSDNAIDDFEVFVSGDAAFARYAAIEPLLSPHPDGPVYVPTAEVRRLYQPMERDFLRAFVTTTPEPFVVRLSAQGD